jgi:hypothetical protein
MVVSALSAPAGTVTVILPSAELSEPPLAPITAVTWSAEGGPTGVTAGVAAPLPLELPPDELELPELLPEPLLDELELPLDELEPLEEPELLLPAPLLDEVPLPELLLDELELLEEELELLDELDPPDEFEPLGVEESDPPHPTRTKHRMRLKLSWPRYMDPSGGT